MRFSENPWANLGRITEREVMEAEFLNRYVIHRWDDFARQEGDGRYRRVGRPLQPNHIYDHVTGHCTIGVYQAVYPDETCRWIAYDIDDYGDGLAEIQKSLLLEQLAYNGVPYYIENSGSPGSQHVWVFLERPTSLQTAYNFSRAMTLIKGHFTFSGEIFPKQQFLSEEKMYGNLLKMPFGVNRKNGRRSCFEKDVLHMEIETVDLGKWKNVSLPKPKMKTGKTQSGNVEPTGKRTRTGSIFLLPCTKRIIDAEIQLRREPGHRLRIAIASDYLKAGYPEEEVAELFASQMDYNFEESLHQVKSLRGYNRPSCDTMRRNCRMLEYETGFDIDSVCEKCMLRDEDHDKINRKHKD